MVSLPRTVEALMGAGLTPHEAIRVHGGKCTDGPIAESVRSAWGKLPFVGSGVVHFWRRLAHDGIGDCSTLCGMRGRETERARLLHPGNLTRCARCVAIAQKKRIA